MAITDRYPVRTDAVPDVSVFDAVIENGRRRDVVGMAAVPVVLLALNILPLPIRAAPVADPTITSAYTALVVHASVGHLLADVIAFITVVSTAYVLCLSADRRTEFLTAFVSVLLVFPVVVSGLNPIVERPPLGYGLSGVVFAFLGFLSLSLYWYACAQFDDMSTVALLPVSFFAGAGAIAALAVPAVPARVAALVVATVGGLAYAVSMVGQSYRPFGAPLGRNEAVIGPVELAAGALVVLLVLPLGTFPIAPVTGNAAATLYTHVSVYCLGFAVPASAVHLGGRVKRSVRAGWPGREDSHDGEGA